MSSPDELKAEALRVYQLGRASRCRDLLEEAAAAAPERADLWYRLALARLEQAAVDAGVEALEEAFTLDPERAQLEEEFMAPVDALLTRRPTFKNLVKLKKQIREGKPVKLRARTPRSPKQGPSSSTS
jgi:predicted Zn-dependent protease